MRREKKKDFQRQSIYFGYNVQNLQKLLANLIIKVLKYDDHVSHCLIMNQNLIYEVYLRTHSPPIRLHSKT